TGQHALAGEHARARTLGPPADLDGEPRLAGAAFAADEHDAALAAGEPLDLALECGERVGATRERGPVEVRARTRPVRVGLGLGPESSERRRDVRGVADP